MPGMLRAWPFRALARDFDREVPPAPRHDRHRIARPLLCLAVSKHWRLVLVGDVRQMQAVGCGGVFARLWRTVCPTDWPPSTSRETPANSRRFASLSSRPTRST